MHVLFLSPVSFFKGGAERSLFDLLKNPHITAHVATPHKGPITEQAEALGYATCIVPFGSIEQIHRPFSFIKACSALADLWKAAQHLKKECRMRNITIVHSNGLKAHAINCLAYRLGGARAILHIRDIPYTNSELWVWKILARACDQMIIVSRACWPTASLPNNVHIIYNGTPIIEHDHTPIVQTNTSINLGFVGRIHPAKGLHLLLEWMAHAKQHGSSLCLRIRGTFSEDAPDYEHEIHQKIHALGLEHDVFFDGFIDNPTELYQNIDVTIVPSHIPDPLPRSVMESMARGIPVCGYPAGGIKEMIIDKETGYFVSDAQSFSDALAHMQSNPERIAHMSKRAKQHIMQHFTLEALHRKVHALYEA